MFGTIMTQVFGSFVPIKFELLLDFSAVELIEAHIHGFCFLGDDFLLMIPAEVELSIRIGKGGFGHPILKIFWYSGDICLEVMNVHVSSSLAADDMGNLINCEIERMGLLILRIGSSSLRMMCTPDQLHDLDALR